MRATTFYTTGTTGNPKGVYFSHRQLVLHTLAVLGSLASTPEHQRFHRGDVYLPITPMFHVHAWGVPYVATAMGVKQVYPGRYLPDTYGGRHYYGRQLRDMKFSFEVEDMPPEGFTTYVQVCGATLARAHARTSDPAQISGYLGKKDTFDQAIADFAEAYVDQTERDHQALLTAIQDGRMQAEVGI